MTAVVPPQVLDWLESRRMETVEVHPLRGRFRANLLSLTVKGESGRQKELICKVTDRRSAEVNLYERLLLEEQSLAPVCIGIVPTQTGTALLMERFGTTLTEALSDLSPTERKSLLCRAGVQLADMHARLEHNTVSQPGASKFLTSLQEAAEPWRQKTVEELRGFVQTPDLNDVLGGTASMSNKANVSNRTNGINRAKLGELIDIAETWLHTAEKHYAETSDRTTLTHGDPHLGNWLVRDNELRLIDWEYAGVSIPQRDLSIFLQDLLDDREQQSVHEAYLDTLKQHGWDVSSDQFEKDFRYHFLDNTLMMLGWDIASYRLGTLDRETFVRMLTVKSTWIQTSASMVL